MSLCFLWTFALSPKKLFLEAQAQPGAEHGKLSVRVVDILKRRLHGNGLAQLSAPCQLHRPLVAFLKTCILSGQSTLVEAVSIGASHLRITVTLVLARCVLRILCHADYASVACCPDGLLSIKPPGKGRFVCRFVCRNHLFTVVF